VSNAIAAAMCTEASKILYSADGKRRVLIMQRPDGTFRFIEQYWYETFYEGKLVAKGWASLPPISLVFETVPIAEWEAKFTFPWLA
jgi:hypothetical protein